jgi:hypothetical protein
LRERPVSDAQNIVNGLKSRARRSTGAKCRLAEPIEQLGEHGVIIALLRDVTVELSVNVVADGSGGASNYDTFRDRSVRFGLVELVKPRGSQKCTR